MPSIEVPISIKMPFAWRARLRLISAAARVWVAAGHLLGLSGEVTWTGRDRFMSKVRYRVGEGKWRSLAPK